MSALLPERLIPFGLLRQRSAQVAQLARVYLTLRKKRAQLVGLF